MIKNREKISNSNIVNGKITQTKRLLIQEADLEDAVFIFELLNSPNWIEFIGDRGIRSLKDAEQYIHNSLIKSYCENGFGLYKMLLKKENYKPIGLCGLVKRTKLDHPDIGFAILPEYEGKGYTYEAAKSILWYVHSEIKLTTILAITSKENFKSQGLLKKLGLKYTNNLQLETGENELMLFSS